MKDLTNQVGRFLSLVLRHKPEEIGVHLDNQGWTPVDELIVALNSKFSVVDRQMIDRIVAENNKQRFALSDDGKKIRANQGHSVQVDLERIPKKPPTVLYHGTATRFLDSILAEGIMSKSRMHVHLSADKETASNVGRRHGILAMLEISAKQMAEDGFDFFLSENGVWLTEHVPRIYLIHRDGD